MGFIHVDHIGKAFKRYHHKSGRLFEWLGGHRRHELKWVLRDITFEVDPGESVGILGFNGAGKSTLLKILAGTTRPTTGSVNVRGRVSALLELGIGFHSDFTGRQNAYMAGQLRGLTAAELDLHMSEIEAFADIGDYIDQPLRVYSSGMQLRLAFSVATAVRPDILIVDEALAVGDVLFQQKCFDRIRAFREAGTTLLFVSHAMNAVYALCERAMLLHDGRIAIDASPKEAIDLYNALAIRARDTRPSAINIADKAGGGGEDVSRVVEGEDFDAKSDGIEAMRATGSFSTHNVSILSVVLLHAGRPVEALVSDSEIDVIVKTRFGASFDDPHVGFQIRDPRGEAVFMTNTHCMSLRIGPVRQGDVVAVKFRFRASLSAGDYSITAGVANGGLAEGSFREALSRVQEVRRFSVLRNPEAILWSGVYNLAPACSIERSRAGAG